MTPSPMILHVVDDTRAFLVAVRQTLASVRTQDALPSFLVETFASPEEWLRRIETGPDTLPALCLFDISMHGDDEAGLHLARAAKVRLPETVVVMYSQFDDADTIMRLMDAGADSFVSKKTPLADLPRELSQAHSVALRKRPTRITQDGSELARRCAGETLQNIAGRIPGLLNSAVRAVHVEGETGTGKEVVADLISIALQGASRPLPFVRVNCGALSASLLESELFGHRKGAFTGANADKEGLIESAHGGWIFLDEVACLSPAAQVSLLRVLENQELLRVGDTRPRKLDVRVLSACNESLARKVDDGTFRSDLRQRLTETTITLPPLRARKGEIEALALHFCRTLEGGPFDLNAAAMELLKRNDWKEGNARQLRNCLRAMTEYSGSRLLGPNSIPREIFAAITRAENAVTTIELLSSPPPLAAPIPFPAPRLAPRPQGIPELTARAEFVVSPSDGLIPELEERLFCFYVKALLQADGPGAKWTLRSLATRTGLTRMTLARRLADVLASGLMKEADLPADFRQRNMGTLSKGVINDR